jgi:hypothetical protein
MGIDYIVDLDCPAKRALGVETIVQCLKARSRADMVMRLSREAGDTRAPEAITFQTMLRRPSGDEVVDVSVGQLYAQAAALDPHRPGCASCVANANAPQGFGCVRYISYPIARETEQWLWARLPSDVQSTAGQMLMRAVHDFGWDGAQAREMRAQGNTFFESQTPLQGRYPNGFTLTSDQLFHMMFQVGHLGDTHAAMLCLFLGVVPHSTDPAAMADPSRRAQLLQWANVPAHQGQVEDMAGFLRACILAARAGCAVLIDG